MKKVLKFINMGVKMLLTLDLGVLFLLIIHKIEHSKTLRFLINDFPKMLIKAWQFFVANPMIMLLVFAAISTIVIFNLEKAMKK